MEPVDTFQKLEDANFAMVAWMKSQGISPFDGVMVAEWFISRMIFANMTSKADFEEKLLLSTKTIREFVALIQSIESTK